MSPISVQIQEASSTLSTRLETTHSEPDDVDYLVKQSSVFEPMSISPDSHSPHFKRLLETTVTSSSNNSSGDSFYIGQHRRENDKKKQLLAITSFWTNHLQ